MTKIKYLCVSRVSPFHKNEKKTVSLFMYSTSSLSSSTVCTVRYVHGTYPGTRYTYHPFQFKQAVKRLLGNRKMSCKRELKELHTSYTDNPARQKNQQEKSSCNIASDIHTNLWKFGRMMGCFTVFLWTISDYWGGQSRNFCLVRNLLLVTFFLDIMVQRTPFPFTLNCKDRA